MATLPELSAKLNAGRVAFVGALESLSPAERSSRTGADAWSPVEIAEHVYLTEKNVLKGLSRQLDPRGERRQLKKPSRTRFAALMAALRSPKKFRVPEHATGISPAGLHFEEIQVDWMSFPGQWETILSAFPIDLANEGLIRHPITGPMTLKQSIRFLTAHTARHCKQLERAVQQIQPLTD